MVVAVAADPEEVLVVDLVVAPAVELAVVQAVVPEAVLVVEAEEVLEAEQVVAFLASFGAISLVDLADLLVEELRLRLVGADLEPLDLAALVAVLEDPAVAVLVVQVEVPEVDLVEVAAVVVPEALVALAVAPLRSCPALRLVYPAAARAAALASVAVVEVQQALSTFPPTAARAPEVRVE